MVVGGPAEAVDSDGSQRCAGARRWISSTQPHIFEAKRYLIVLCLCVNDVVVVLLYFFFYRPQRLKISLLHLHSGHLADAFIRSDVQ